MLIDIACARRSWFADRNGLAAIWTPERHFHSFGGLYPNPAVLGAAIATITQRVSIRGGSVVLPLNNPIRVAEEWAVVDNLSGGRAAIAVASGWHVDDFVLNPVAYHDRKTLVLDGIDTLRNLWHGDRIEVTGVAGKKHAVEIFPKPVQAEIPIWLTSSGTAETCVAAGLKGANLLTHLLGQTVSELSGKLSAYRSAFMPRSGMYDRPLATVMLHTYVGKSSNEVREEALAPLKKYLTGSVDLIAKFAESLGMKWNPSEMKATDLDDLVTYAAERYMEDSGLFGTPARCLERLEAFRDIGVDEVAALIDFGIDREHTLESLRRAAQIIEDFNKEAPSRSDDVDHLGIRNEKVTLLQCTPTFMTVMLQSRQFREFLTGIKAVLLGGEAVPTNLVERVRACGVPNVFNMFGPTETTIWSAARLVMDGDCSSVGGPIVNTRLHVVDENLKSLPPGVAGEIVISGAGVGRGYLGDPIKTREAFIRDPFGNDSSSRAYRTGDIAYRNEDGTIQLLGRADQQIKLRGFRVEIGDIEARLMEIDGVSAAAVTLVDAGGERQRLAALVVLDPLKHIATADVRAALNARLPYYMIPYLESVSAIPMNVNGKVDRRAISRYVHHADVSTEPSVAGKGAIDLAVKIREVWMEVLNITNISEDDNFFDLGGHSLLMAHIHSRLQGLLGKEFPLVWLLEEPTIRGIAHKLSLDGTAKTRVEFSDRQQRQALHALRERALVH